MTAVVPTTVEDISARVDKGYGTDVKIREVFVSVTSTATSNTIDLNTYVSGGISGILGCMLNDVDGAHSTTYPTYSSTTITLAQHAGSGVCKMIFKVY